MSWKHYAANMGLFGAAGAAGGALVDTENRARGALIGGTMGLGFGAFEGRNDVRKATRMAAEDAARAETTEDKVNRIRNSAWHKINRTPSSKNGQNIIGSPDVVSNKDLPPGLKKLNSARTSAFFDELALIKAASEETSEPFQSELPILARERLKNSLKYGLYSGLGVGTGTMAGKLLLSRLMPHTWNDRQRDMAGMLAGGLMAGSSLGVLEAMRLAREAEEDVVKQHNTRV